MTTVNIKKIKGCSKCKRKLPESEFREVHSRGKLVFFSWCRDCEKAYDRERSHKKKEYYQKNREKILRREKEYREHNKEKNKDFVPDPNIKNW